ncbi:coiled-coil domain-containing protein 192-like isoform X1 [Leucoraja erinacea]|uniref:coiled-coil domain-containing protein 192-like isoform X1 n=1 Tax=Leucoraja erinaceus TaxID=7782 RepID=UPI002453B0CB|nr:coiled-coil domain-containing protein 192-like isoform X1 [Leucoraja erinacea]
MGNVGASGRVTAISLKPEGKQRVANCATLRQPHSIAQTNNIVKETSNDINDMIKGLNFSQIGSVVETSEIESRLQEAEEKARIFATNLAEMEMCKIELSDQVMWLEEQLESMRNKLKSAGLYEETLSAKDKYIKRLEAENKCSNAQLVQLKQKHKRTIKKLHVQLAQVKQDSAISVIKAKEKIQTLENEIQIIKEQTSSNRHYKEDFRSHDTETHRLSIAEESRMRLVLELSTQLSQQQENIFLLEKTLEEKDRQVTGLATQLFTQPAGGASVHLLLQPNLPALLNNNTCTTEYDQRLGAVPILADNLTLNRFYNDQKEQG